MLAYTVSSFRGRFVLRLRKLWRRKKWRTIAALLIIKM